MEMDKSKKYYIVRYMIDGIEIVNKYPVKSKLSVQDAARNLVMNKIRK